MISYHLDRPGTLEGLVQCASEIPRPGNGEVLVRIRAAALNFRDLMIVDDRYVFPVPPGLIPLSDGAGEIVEVGPRTGAFKPGDRVAVNFIQKWIAGELRPEVAGSDVGGSLPGVLAEHIVLPESGLVALAPHLSFEEGASLACAGLTAWNGLVGQRPLQPGDTVLIQGTGGVSIFALQFAKLFGARVIATTSSEAKAAKLKALGADEVIDYVADQAWDETVLRLTGGVGVDRVVEVGGPGTLERSLRAVRIGGRVSAIGFVGGLEGSLSPFPMMARAASLDAVWAGSRRDFESMMRAIAHHRLRPVIDRVFEFDAAHEAYRHLRGRRHVGKVVIRVGA